MGFDIVERWLTGIVAMRRLNTWRLADADTRPVLAADAIPVLDSSGRWHNVLGGELQALMLDGAYWAIRQRRGMGGDVLAVIERWTRKTGICPFGEVTDGPNAAWELRYQLNMARACHAALYGGTPANSGEVRRLAYAYVLDVPDALAVHDFAEAVDIEWIAFAAADHATGRPDGEAKATVCDRIQDYLERHRVLKARYLAAGMAPANGNPLRQPAPRAEAA